MPTWVVSSNYVSFLHLLKSKYCYNNPASTQFSYFQCVTTIPLLTLVAPFNPADVELDLQQGTKRHNNRF